MIQCNLSSYVCDWFLSTHMLLHLILSLKSGVTLSRTLPFPPIRIHLFNFLLLSPLTNYAPTGVSPMDSGLDAGCPNLCVQDRVHAPWLSFLDQSDKASPRGIAYHHRTQVQVDRPSAWPPVSTAYVTATSADAPSRTSSKFLLPCIRVQVNEPIKLVHSNKEPLNISQIKQII
jgi:hypothetical protein